VAASLSAISEKQLRALRIQNAEELQNHVPSLTIKSQSIGTSAYNIRGVGYRKDKYPYFSQSTIKSRLLAIAK
jgi:hypothetical protein